LSRISNTRDLKNEAYKHIARLGKALSSGPRLEILDLLTQGPRTVESIANEVGQSIANTSHHLRTLARAQLVRANREGLFVTYRIADEETATLFARLRTSAEQRYHELRETTARLIDERGACESIDAKTLATRIKSGDVTVVDVRPPAEYEAGHLPGSINIPIGELETRAAELPADRDVVAYCRGPLCVMAVNAATTLQKHGLRASHFDRAVTDWRALGFPVESNSKVSP
jgi:rhodanese-related sulfurtransferase